MRLPGLIDPHVHLREPGAVHKEDISTGTAAALAGGFTTVLAMPNTCPPLTDKAAFDQALALARQKARCDYGFYIGATRENAAGLVPLATRAAGLKMYLDSTYGPLHLKDMSLWMPHFEKFPHRYPIVVHAESRTMAVAILFASLFDRPVHIAHVSLKEEVLLIKAAKARGIKVTCEVCPHHLFLTSPPSASLVGDKVDCRLEVRPRLASPADVEALWDNLEVIDCFATDHAPHLLSEKDGEHPPPGFPGLETALPLLLTAVHEERLTLDELIARMYTNPRRIFRLPEQPETWVEVDYQARYEIRASNHHSRCGWTPFEGWQLQGRVRHVVLRGKDAFRDGQVLAPPGSGRNVRM